MIHKEAYLEISDKCYAKCHMCDMPNHRVEAVPVDVVKERLLKLQDAGFRQVRLTGKEPMTYYGFRQIVNFMRDNEFLIDMTTTLLCPDLRQIDYLRHFHKLRVSLFALYEQYKPFYGVDKFHILERNIKYLNEIYPNTIYFNYTLSDTGKETNWSIDSARNIVNFINETGLDNYCFNIFPEFRYKEGTSPEMRAEINSFLEVLAWNKIKYDYFSGIPKSISTCTVMKHRLFVKHSGQVYPCCMTSGEVGQGEVIQAYIGNIDTTPLHDIMYKPLEGLTNPVCMNCTWKYYTLMP